MLIWGCMFPLIQGSDIWSSIVGNVMDGRLDTNGTVEKGINY